MARRRLDDADSLTVADVIHERFSALPATITVGEVRAWFEASTSRRMALLADEGRYVGSLTPGDVGGDTDPARPAAEVAKPGPTVAPGDSARTGEQVALLTEARRVPVVDAAGRLLGIVSVTGDLSSFCGTG